MISRCLYGVDVNPMAAELCRVGLWLEALEPGKPLSFLDRHIRVGNSLLGTTPELIYAGLPDAAFKPIHGDDHKVSLELKKRNRAERESGQRLLGFVAELDEKYDSLASRGRRIDQAPDATLADIRSKDEQFRRMQQSGDYRYAQQVADAWCAAFVWPKRSIASDALTTETLRRLHENPDALAPEQREETERITGGYQFFHWYLEFPEVFANGGFDCVLGNPPWEHTELKEKEWFADRHAGIVEARTGAERKRLIAALEHEDPSLYASYAAALRKHDGLSHLLRSTGRFPRGARGRINLYAAFVEGMRRLLNDRGRAGCVLPTGIATDDSTKVFFQDVVEKRSLVSLFDFENKGIFFPGVHSSYKFCLFTTGSGNAPISNQAEFVFFAHSADDLYAPDRRFTLSADDIALLNPNTRTCPIFRSRMDAELTKAIYWRVPALSREASGDDARDDSWGMRFRQGMFNMTSDSGLFRTKNHLEADGWSLEGNVFHKNGEECLPLYEAKMIHHFDHRWSSFRSDSGDSEETATDVPLEDKQNPNFDPLPRYWVEAREVYLRSANLPKEFLAALRTRDTSAIVIGVANLLFADRLRKTFGSNKSSSEGLYSEWIKFVEIYPFARALIPDQIEIFGNSHGQVSPRGRSICSRHLSMTAKPAPETLWPSVANLMAVGDTINCARQYEHPVNLDRQLPNEEDALVFAEMCLKQSAPRWLIGIRKITRSTDERTQLGGVLPLAGVGDSLPIWMTDVRDTRVVLPSLLSSFACDFLVRVKLGGANYNFFIARQIPVLPPRTFQEATPWDAGLTLHEWLLPRVLELSYTTWNLQAFAVECGWTGPPFRWDEDRRFLLRCELDAAFFHMYLRADRRGRWQRPDQLGAERHGGTSEHLAELSCHFPAPRDAVDYIMDTFPIVRRKDEGRYGEYRTKRVILDIYDAMQIAVAVGAPYRSVLDPPPADLTCSRS